MIKAIFVLVLFLIGFICGVIIDRDYLSILSKKYDKEDKDNDITRKS